MANVPRVFVLERDVDVSGISGTGKVAEGVIFSDGEAVLHWLGKFPTTTSHPGGIESVKAIHGHGGATRIILTDAVDRLSRIAQAHSKYIDAHGGTNGNCMECGWRWPCPTNVWATTERDPLAMWDPANDDEEELAP